MKKVLNILLLAATAAFAAGCSDWTETEALNYEPEYPNGSAHGEAYYRNLREYKASTDHTIAFGWYSEWTGVGTQMGTQLMGIPDSMDFVSMWGNWHSLSPEKKLDKEKARRIKGTRAMICFIVANLGDQTTPPEVRQTKTVDGVTYADEGSAVKAFWGLDREDEVSYEAAIRKYARSILDTIRKYDWDGFDLDLEPHYGSPGNIASYPARLHILLEEMSTELGPKSGTDKLLCVDGEPNWLQPEDCHLLDYFLLQAYGDTSDASIDNRINNLNNTFGGEISLPEIIRKTVITANFESYASTGGLQFNSRVGGRVNQLKGYAMYKYPNITANIGGIGAFRFGFDTNFRYLREAIGVANPVVK